MNSVAVPSSVQHFVDVHDAVQAGLPGQGLAWLQNRRSEALRNFARIGFPTPRNEQWKYTRVSGLEKHGFKLPVAGAARLSSADLDRFRFTGPDSLQLVFVDGRFQPALSHTPAVDHCVCSLAAEIAAGNVQLERHLGRYADGQASAFTALNEAFIADGAFIHLQPGQVLAHPIHLLFVTTEAAAEGFTAPRNLVVAGAGSQACVIESYVSLTGADYFTNATTELVVGENAALEHIKLQDEGVGAYHIGTVQAALGRNSRLQSHALSFGARLSRHDINAQLDAEGAECTLNGLYMADGRQHVDFHTSVDHVRPHCRSQEYYKGILGGRSRGVFNGRVHVHPNAQKTDSEQANRNLLLSRHAEVDTKPELEIYADDVKCSHGATVGQLDEDMLFYLRSRGIDTATARGLLTYGFAQDVIERISVPAVREHLESLLVSRVPAADYVKSIV